MLRQNTCVLLYPNPQTTEQGIDELLKQNFNMETVSVLGKGFQKSERVIGMYTRAGQLCFRGDQTKLWQKLWLHLSHASLFWLADFGSLVAAGPIIRLLVERPESIEVGGGFTVFGETLFSIGIPIESIVDYEKAIKAGTILLIVHGTRSDVERACHILHSETQQVAVHMA